MKVTLFRNFNQVAGNLELDHILEQIRSGKYKAKIQSLRELLRQGREDEYNDKKRSLPAFTPSMVGLISMSGTIPTRWVSVPSG